MPEVTTPRVRERQALAGLADRLYSRFRGVLHELVKYGVVGATAFAVDVGIFNLVQYGPMAPLHGQPLIAKGVSVVIATTVAYLGNRYWTFRHRGRSGLRREYVLFFFLNAVGLAIALACLAVSHYALGFDGVVADNIAANVVGLALATTFRFLSYRRWVFPAPASDVTNIV